MSRLTQPPVKDGDAINAASLNDRFTQFTQTDLNQFNTRDAAIDLPQFKGGVTRFLAPQMFIGAIGANDWKHATDVTATGQVTGSLPHVVSDAAGAATPLSFGATGMTLTQNEEMLRVYWDMSVRPRWEGTRPYTASDLIWVFSTGGSTQNVFSGYGCWAFWLQWDITSNALANFVNVPGQGNFNGIVTGSRGGNPLSTCQSTSVVQSIIETGGAPNNGKLSGGVLTIPVGWTAVDGAWHYLPTGSSPTIFGVRVVFSGPFGAYNVGATNYLIRADNVAGDARLDYNGGGITGLKLRVK
tara:strand:- start:2693 stop:3589 length:897 start_codon:yes stop_codon:yes gene_type:complete